MSEFGAALERSQFSVVKSPFDVIEKKVALWILHQQQKQQHNN